jgi:hypothetical protein
VLRIWYLHAVLFDVDAYAIWQCIVWASNVRRIHYHVHVIP